MLCGLNTIYIPVGQQQHCLCFVVLVVLQECWGNIGVGPVAGEMRADSIVGVQVGILSEGAWVQTSPKSVHLMNYYFKSIEEVAYNA